MVPFPPERLGPVTRMDEGPEHGILMTHGGGVLGPGVGAAGLGMAMTTTHSAEDNWSVKLNNRVRVNVKPVTIYAVKRIL